MIISNERLEKNYNIAFSIIENVIGKDRVKEKIRNIEKVGISPNAKRRHGVCKIRGNSCIIEVSKHLFNFEDKEMITTLIHEILHTFKDTKGHGEMWQWYANQITNNTEYKITRTRIKLNICLVLQTVFNNITMLLQIFIK